MTDKPEITQAEPVPSDPEEAKGWRAQRDGIVRGEKPRKGYPRGEGWYRGYDARREWVRAGRPMPISTTASTPVEAGLDENTLREEASRIADTLSQHKHSQRWMGAYEGALTVLHTRPVDPELDRNAVLEEAAKVADVHAERAWDIGNKLGQNDACSSGRNYGARDIAAAIRALRTEGGKQSSHTAGEAVAWLYTHPNGERHVFLEKRPQFTSGSYLGPSEYTEIPLTPLSTTQSSHTDLLEALEKVRRDIFASLRNHEVGEQCFAEVAMITQAAIAQHKGQSK